MGQILNVQSKTDTKRNNKFFVISLQIIDLFGKQVVTNTN